MSYADKVFKEMCSDIIENGFSSEGYDVRPKWEDGTPAHTIKKFGAVNRYDLSKEFPAVTLRKTFIKSAADEMLWIWQKKSNNIHELNSHVWDEWADKRGSIGKAYGYQQALKHPYKGITVKGLKKAFPGIEKGIVFEYGDMGDDAWGYNIEKNCNDQEYDFVNHPIAIKYGSMFYMTQLDKAIYDLVNNPLSRRIIVSMWNPEDLHAMHLEPCAYSMTFNVTGNKLNGILNQRSQDILAANAWNIAQYSILLMMIAQVTGYEPGEFIHVIADAHIYDRHVPIIKELIERDEHPAPEVKLNPNVKSFYDFTTDDIYIKHFGYGEQIGNIPIAI